MGKTGKQWKTVATKGRVIDVDDLEASDATVVEAAQSDSVVTSKDVSPEATEAEKATAFEACYKGKKFLTAIVAFRDGSDEELAAASGGKLRKASQGRNYALHKEDLPKGVDFRLTVTVADKKGAPVERQLGSSIRYRRKLGLQRAVEHMLSAPLRSANQNEEWKGFRGALAESDLSAEVKAAHIENYWRRYTKPVTLAEAEAYLAKAEPSIADIRKKERVTAKAKGRDACLQMIEDLKS